MPSSHSLLHGRVFTLRAHTQTYVFRTRANLELDGMNDRRSDRHASIFRTTIVSVDSKQRTTIAPPIRLLRLPRPPSGPIVIIHRIRQGVANDVRLSLSVTSAAHRSSRLARHGGPSRIQPRHVRSAHQSMGQPHAQPTARIDGHASTSANKPSASGTVSQRSAWAWKPAPRREDVERAQSSAKDKGQLLKREGPFEHEERFVDPEQLGVQDEDVFEEEIALQDADTLLDEGEARTQASLVEKAEDRSGDEPLFGRGQYRRTASRTVLNGGMTQQEKVERKAKLEIIALRQGVSAAQAEMKRLKREDARRRQRRKAYLLSLQPYIEKNLRLIELEAEEDRKVVEQQRMWTDAKMRQQGIMLQGLEGFWLQGSVVSATADEEAMIGKSQASTIAPSGSKKGKAASAPFVRTAVFHRPGKAKLGWTRIQKGDQVELRSERKKSVDGTAIEREDTDAVLATVRVITEYELRLTFREPPTDLDLLSSPSWRVDLAYNDTIEARLRQSVEALTHDVDATRRAGVELSGSYLVEVLMEKGKTGQPPSPEQAPIGAWIRRHRSGLPEPELEHLTTSQRQAVDLMLNERVSLIQGPPGTGKTSTIVAAIKILKRHYCIPHPILLTSHTNVAVDNLAQGCKEAGLEVVRAGPVARVREAIMDITLDGRMDRHPSKRRLDDVEAQRIATIQALQQDQRRGYQATAEKDVRALQRTDADSEERVDSLAFGDIETSDVASTSHEGAKPVESIALLRKQLSRLIQRSFLIRREMETDIFADADVVCCTALSAPLIHAVDFPLVFFDEATMATEPITLATMVKGCQQLSLIGDHKQLSPLIRSRDAQSEGLGESMFERLMERGDLKSVMLDTQHRMHPSLAAFSGQEFYAAKLMDGKRTSQMQPLQSCFTPQTTEANDGSRGYLTFVDHEGRERLANSMSLENHSEAELVVSIVADLLALNDDLDGRDIAIITPYAGQRDLLARSLLEPSSHLRKLFAGQLEKHGGAQAKARIRELVHLEVETIDGFEGREKRAIVFSMVRNNNGRFWGFLREHKRWNVALTRARNGLWLVGSMAMLERRSAAEEIAAAKEAAAVTAAGQTPDADEEDGIEAMSPWRPTTGEHAGFITRFAAHLRRNGCVIDANSVRV